MKTNKIVAGAAAAALALTVAGGIAGGIATFTASENTQDVTGVSVLDTDTTVLAAGSTKRGGQKAPVLRR